MLIYPKYDPGTYVSRDLYRKVQETLDIRHVWVHLAAQQWQVDPELLLKKCKDKCDICEEGVLDYGRGKNNHSKRDIDTPSVDHFIPRSISEDLINEYDNLRVICKRCNTIKSNAVAKDAFRFITIGLYVLSQGSDSNLDTAKKISKNLMERIEQLGVEKALT